MVKSGQRIYNIYVNRLNKCDTWGNCNKFILCCSFSLDMQNNYRSCNHFGVIIFIFRELNFVLCLYIINKVECSKLHTWYDTSIWKRHIDEQSVPFVALFSLPQWKIGQYIYVYLLSFHGNNKLHSYCSRISTVILSCFGLLGVLDSDSIAIEPLYRFSFHSILQTVFPSQGSLNFQEA